MPDRLVVFVCTGNICRSPMAEYLLKDRLGNDTAWEVVSAGIAAGRGMPACRSAVEVLAEKGIDVTTHASRPVDRELLENAALIVVMTGSHRENLVHTFPKVREKVFLLKSFDSNGDGGDVDDPIGSSLDVYYRICEEIEGAMPGLVEFMSRLELK